jgi:hypothetical protein
MYDYLYLNSIRDGCQTAGRLDSYLTDKKKCGSERSGISGRSVCVKNKEGFGLPASGLKIPLFPPLKKGDERGICFS